MNSTTIEFLLISTILWPFILFLVSFFKSVENIVVVLINTATLPLVGAFIIGLGYETYHIPWLLFGSTFSINEVSRAFLLLAAILWSISTIYAQFYFTKNDEKVIFFRFFLLAMIGNFALIMSSDLVSFYFAFTLMSFASYVLVIHNKNNDSIRAGLIYIILVVLGEIMIFVAFIMAAHTADSIVFEEVQRGLQNSAHRDLILFFAFIGFGIKAGFLGLHFWLPLAHPVAPAPASAVLSGSMIKAGIIGWIKFFPVGIIELYSWGIIFIVFGFLGTFYATIVGLTQNDGKTILAYSSISKVGIISVILGISMLYPNTWRYLLFTILFYILHHGLSKGALFMGAGICGSKSLINRRIVWGLLLIPALSMIGAPFTSGMFAKHMIKENIELLSYPLDTVLIIILSISTVLTTSLMFKFLYLIRPNTKPYGKEAIIGTLFPLFLLVIIIGIFPFTSIDSFKNILINSLLDTLLILFTLILFIVIVKRNIFKNFYKIPSGDIVIVFEKLFINLQNYFQNFLFYHSQKKTASISYKENMMQFIDKSLDKTVYYEKLWSLWYIATFILLIILMFTGIKSFIFEAIF